MSRVVFDYQFNHGAPCFPCTDELFHNVCKSANVTRRIKAFRDNGDDQAKRGLPAVMWQAHYPDGHRTNDGAEFSGLYMLDIDHVENPMEIYKEWKATQDFPDLGIMLVFITPSGHGLKVVAIMRRRTGVPNTISAHQQWLASMLGLKEYDAKTKDLARMAFVPLAKEILYENPRMWDMDKEVEQLDEETAPQGGAPRQGKEIADYDDRIAVKGNFTINGRPMVDYVLGWFAANGGKPQQGQRNNTIFRCACYFRNFTDYSAKILAENIPSFGLSESEMLQVCTSACNAPRAKYWPRDIAELLDADTAEAEDDAEEKAADDTPPEMPPLIQFFIEKSDPRFKAASVLAMLPILGGLATDLRMRFPDGEIHSPSFMCVIMAPQASGKSYARRIWKHLTQRLHDEDAISWEQERLWRQTLAENMRDFKKVEGASKDPQVVIRLVPSKITEPQFFKRLHYAKGKHLIGFYEEIDSLTKEVKGGSYDDKRDLFREAFDNAEHGRDVANVESFSGMERIFYNFLALGTPNSVHRFYNNPEDGLVSRTIFYQLPVGVFDAMPEHLPISVTESAQVRQRCDVLIDLKQSQPEMLDSEGHVLLDTAEYLDPIWREWRSMAELRAIKNGSEAEGILLKRASVIAWRASCLYWLLWGLKIDDDTIAKLRKAFFWTADMVLREQCALFAQPLDNVQTSVASYKSQSLYDKLPQIFTYEDMIANSNGKSKKTQYNRTQTWLGRGLIVKINAKQFQKI